MKIGKINTFFLRVWQFIILNLHTLLFLAGLFVINYAVYIIHSVAGLMMTGLFLVLIAILLNPKEEGR
ncbi:MULTISPECIES: hypothetical protein [Bacillus]|uniref:hypothetical protein n=1 Tax=Bacillus TaxID=1386 RepID=UPI0003012CF1|nr:MULTISPECIES: hypothetical protein [Bacillus]MBW7636516.1 hypothetical protein [Bacillus licheniformis]MDN5388843.1 hypothetical protein [Bacillus sp. LB7]MEC5225246.1 hypothetical protein [Bacillus licheniformis]